MMPARFLERLNSGDVIVLRAGAEAPLRLAVQAILPGRSAAAAAGPSKETKSRKLLRQLIALRKMAKRK
jgi:hypothetical protein